MPLILLCGSRGGSVSAGGGGGDTPTLWVNSSTGDDSRTKATVASSGGSLPWATIGRAVWGSTNRASPSSAQAASAGDVVLITGDQSFTSIQCIGSTDVWLSPANDGTSVNPIKFVGDGLVEFRITDSSVACLIGSNGRDYIQWKNIRIDTEVPPIGDSGPVALVDTVGSVVDGCTLIGVGWPIETYDAGSGYHVTRPAVNVASATNATPTVLTTSSAHGRSAGDAIRVTGVSGVANGDYYCSTPSSTTLGLYTDQARTNPVAGTGGGAGGTIQKLRQDNYEAIFCVSAFECTISNNTMSSYRGYGENSSAVLTYGSCGLTIEHNDMSDCEGYGVFLKGMFTNSEDNFDSYGPTSIRYNRIHDCDQGGVDVGLFPATSTNPCLIYQNIIKNVGRGVQMLDLVGAPEWYPLNVKVVNNVFANCDAGFVPRFPVASCAYEHHNNIYFSTTYPVQVWGAPGTMMVESRVDGDRNCAFTYTAYAQLDPEGDNDSYALGPGAGTWKNTFAFIDQNSVNTDPDFVNETDYVAQAASLATLGRVVHSIGGSNGSTIPVGCYITGSETIGTT